MIYRLTTRMRETDSSVIVHFAANPIVLGPILASDRDTGVYIETQKLLQGYAAEL